MNLRETVYKVADWLYARRTQLVLVWFALSVLGSTAVRVVGIVCGLVMIAAWVMRNAVSKG